MKRFTEEVTKERLYLQAQKDGYSVEQLNAVMGSLMGDGYLSRSGKRTCNMRWNHGWKQHEYNLHKYHILQEHATKEPYKKENAGYGDYWSVLTLKASETLHLLYVLTHPEGTTQKTITQKYLGMIEHPIALAWWFMDDGTRQKNYNSGSILTNGFSEQEVTILANWMHTYWGITASTAKVCHSSTGRKATVLRINKQGYIALSETIASYIPSCMEYKTKIITMECAYCGTQIPKAQHWFCCPECAKAYRKIAKATYYQEHKEHAVEKSRQWKAAHRAQINAKAREAYKNLTPEQKERLTLYQQEYYCKNREKINARKRAWRARMKNDPVYYAKLQAERKRYYEKVMADQERRAHRNATSRARRAIVFAENPEKERNQQRAYRAKINADPERKQKQLERDRAAEKRRKEKMTPEQRAEELRKDRERARIRMARIKADLALYEAYKQKNRERYARNKVKKEEQQAL